MIDSRLRNELPIAFKQDDVIAILEGKKTQCRRPLAQNPLGLGPGPNGEEDWPHFLPPDVIKGPPPSPFDTKPMQCHLGSVGDLLWVQERWRKRLVGIVFEASEAGKKIRGANWKEASSLPRGLSRIWLKITSIRAQRLQQITEEDAIAEGVIPFCLSVNKPSEGKSTSYPDTDPEPHRRSFLAGWREEWFGSADSNENPLVWAITFERLKP